MIALATVLSIAKIVEMPYGGSVTLASMLPILLVSYRRGVRFGLGAALVFAVIQQLLGLNNLSYVTTWQSVVAVILLDYIVAFAVIGLGGVFRVFEKNIKSKPGRQAIVLGCGMLFVCVLRYVSHTVAGATVWAGLSIPTEAALVYSLGYNATYMIPETIINLLSAVWVGNALDLSCEIPLPMKRTRAVGRVGDVIVILRQVSLFALLASIAADSVLVFAKLQSPENGEFALSGIRDVNPILFLAVLVFGVAVSSLCFIVSKILEKRADSKTSELC